MADIFDDMFSELSRKLSKNEDVALLKVLLETQRQGGSDALKKKIKTLMDEIVGLEQQPITHGS
jgi:hypothetical protein